MQRLVQTYSCQPSLNILHVVLHKSVRTCNMPKLRDGDSGLNKEAIRKTNPASCPGRHS